MTTLGVSLTADFTLVLTVHTMHQHVTVQVVLHGKTFITNLTLVFLLGDVGMHMTC